MGSTLTYEADGRRRTGDARLSDRGRHRRGRVSVATPIGAALLGLAEGQSIDWTARDGREQRLTVLAVERAAAA